jgi:peptidyl-prolyl cis-trans isomerase B (cyclophilin B)
VNRYSLTLLPVFAALSLSPAFSAAKKPAKSVKSSAALKVPQGDALATIETAKGAIVLDLYTKAAPVTAGNFAKLAKKGFYNGLAFHRVVPGFVIQAGDPYSKNMSDSRIGTGGPGYTIKLEPSATKFKHDAGVIAMARTSDPDSAGSQWYITLGPAHFLDGQYAVFGKVLKGMDVAEKIKVGDKIKKIVIREQKKPGKK